MPSLKQRRRIAAGQDWVGKRTRRMMIGLHIPDYDQVPDYRQYISRGAPPILEQFDAAGLVRRLAQARCQVFYFYNKCHMGNSYHPTDVPGAHVHSALRGRDLFGELVAACLQEGIVPGAVYEFSDTRVPRDHPAWCHRTPADATAPLEITDATEGTKVSGPCLNGPYGDYAIRQAVETVSRYPIRCYWVDFLGLFTFGRWICPYCGEKFRREFGFDFQGAEKLAHADYVKYVKWHHRQYEEYARRMIAAIREVRPDIVFTHNAHLTGNAPGLQTFEQARRICDFMAADLFNLRAGTLQMSWKARAFAGASRLKPAEILFDNEVCVAGDYLTMKGLDSQLADIMTARCVNVAPCTSIIPSINGVVPEDTLALSKRLFAEQIPYEPWFEQLEPLADVGILRSQRAIEFRPAPEDPLEAPSFHSLDFAGWAQALIRSHFLWDVIQDYQLTEEHLRKFKVLILPNAGCLGDEQCRAIRSFVERGGRLIVTGETSLFDEDGEKRADFGLAAVLGVHYVKPRAEIRSLLRLSTREFCAKEPYVTPDGLIFLAGQWEVRAEPTARILGRIEERLAIGVMLNTSLRTELPGLVRHNFGRGTAFYTAGLPGQQYFVCGQDRQKRFMGDLLRALVGRNAAVETDAPETVELFAHRQAGRDHLVVNFVNNVSGISRSSGTAVHTKLPKGSPTLARFDETSAMPALADFTVRIRPPRGARIRRVYQAPSRRVLRVRRIGRDACVTVRQLRVHAMIVAEFHQSDGR